MRAIVISVALLASTGAQSSEAWPEEPTAVFGLKLGDSLLQQAAIVKCPRTMFNNNPNITFLDYNHKGFCYEELPRFGEELLLHNSPDVGAGGHVAHLLMLRNLDVHGLRLTLSKSRAPGFLQVLEARYGKPHKTEAKTYQNKMGATYAGNEYTWSSDAVVVSFAEVGTKPDTSQLLIMTRAYLDAKFPKVNPAAVKDRL